MTILVTGGAGFIGSHLVDALVKRGHQVWAVDNLARGKRDNLPQKAQFLAENIDSSKVLALIRGERPSCIFHLAAQIDVQSSIRDPVIDASINAMSTLRLLNAAHLAGVQKFIMSSTGGAIYGTSATYPTREDQFCQPVSPYGVSKWCAEAYLDYFSRCHAIQCVALRYSNVYGPRQNLLGGAGVVALFAQQLLDDKPVTIYGDGAQTRDFIYVKDVVAANLLALDNDTVSGALNIGTGVETSVRALHQIMSQSGRFIREIIWRPARPGEQRRSCLDNTRARSALGWQPETTLQVGLKETLAWFSHLRGAKTA